MITLKKGNPIGCTRNPRPLNLQRQKCGENSNGGGVVTRLAANVKNTAVTNPRIAEVLLDLSKNASKPQISHLLNHRLSNQLSNARSNLRPRIRKIPNKSNYPRHLRKQRLWSKMTMISLVQADSLGGSTYSIILYSHSLII